MVYFVFYFEVDWGVGEPRLFIFFERSL